MTISVTSSRASPEPQILPVRRAIAEDIADLLREAIILGQFKPNTNLKEADLANTYNVSRSPIREALKRLEREGLVVSRRNRGFVVVALTIEDIEDLYELRRSLETLAIRHAARKRTREDLAAMAAVLDELADLGPDANPVRVAELDVAFHNLIYVAAHNKRIEACWQTIKSQIFRFLVSRLVSEKVFSEVLVAQHQNIRYLIAERNEKDAVAAIRTHLVEAFERLRTLSIEAASEPGKGAD